MVPSNENIIVSLVSVFATTVLGILGLIIRLWLKRDDVISIERQAQFGGWNNLMTQTNALVAELRKQLEDTEESCNRRLDLLRDEIAEMDQVYKNRISVLEKKLILS